MVAIAHKVASIGVNELDRWDNHLLMSAKATLTQRSRLWFCKGESLSYSKTMRFQV